MHHGIEFFYFNPSDVDLINKKINGQFFEKGKWVRKIIDYPDVVDNEPMKMKNKDIYDDLKKTAIFTTNRLGGKNKVFRMLKDSHLFEDVLIPYVLVRNTEDVMTFLNQYNKVLLKPVFSNQGRNIIVIEKGEVSFKLIGDTTSKNLTNEELIVLLNQKYMNPTYICQPFIESKTVDGSPFDIRLHVRKNSEGKWKEVKIYPRIGMGKNITSNISQGGGISPFIPFLQHNFGNEWKNIKNKLELLCHSFPTRFESLYDYDLDALGIDFGIDQKGNIGLFEVNTYPGQQFFYSEDAEVRVEYYRYLLNQKSGDKLD